MKKGFFLTSLIAIVLLNFTSFAQKDKLSLDELKNMAANIPYVFKGEIIDIQFYLGDENGNKLPEGTFHLPNGELGIGFSSAKVKICQILKGKNELSYGTIEIITSSPCLIQPYLCKNENGETVVGWFKGNFCMDAKNVDFFIESKYTAIFFCEKAKYSGKSGFSFDNSIGVYPTIDYIGLGSHWAGYRMTEKQYNSYYNSKKEKGLLHQSNLTYAYWYGNKYNYQSELYTVLSQIDGININETDSCPKMFLPEKENKNTEEYKIRQEQSRENYRRTIERMIKTYNIDTTKTYEEWKKEKQLKNKETR